MRKVFVDTAAWLALINTSDDLHDASKLVLARLQTERAVLLTTEFILLEVADALSRAEVRTQTINFITRLRQLQNIHIIPISESLFEAGWKLYQQRLDKDWGLTDCISFVVMQNETITVAFTADRHFEQAGFTRLLKP